MANKEFNIIRLRFQKFHEDLVNSTDNEIFHGYWDAMYRHFIADFDRATGNAQWVDLDTPEGRLMLAESLLSESEDEIAHLISRADIDIDWATEKYAIGFTDMDGLFDDLRERLIKK